MPKDSTILGLNLCQGEAGPFSGTVYNDPGVYTEQAIFQSAYGGCDSLVTLHLQVLPSAHVNDYRQTCQGESYLWNGITYSQSGIYEQIFTSKTGCDSIVTLELAVVPVYSVNLSLDLCQGESGPLSGTLYEIAGEFIEQAVFNNQNGCDSTVTAYITVHEQELMVVDNGPLPYGMVYHGVVLTQDTQFVLFDTTAFGCLRTISENVTVGPSASTELENSLGLKVSPNPFTNFIQLDFKLPERTLLSASLLDPLGRRVAVLLENNALEAGEHHLGFSKKDLPPGLYLLQVQANGAIVTQRLILASL